MPGIDAEQTNPESQITPKDRSTTTISGESSRTQTPPPPHASSIPGGFLLPGIFVVAAAIGIAYYMRTAALRAWKKYSNEINGEFKAKSRLSPRYISGTINDRPIFMETDMNNDDEAPYYHTRSSMPVGNPAMIVLGLRRKSMLEEAQSRNDSPFYEFGDPDFDKRFHLIANVSDSLPELVDTQIRQLLVKYSDIEIYLKSNVIEWRRSGEVSDLESIRKLNAALSKLAHTVDHLPKRTISLSQKLADEELIRKGI